MTVQLSKVPKYILEAAAKNLGWRWNDEKESIEPYLKKLESKTALEIFDHYLRWEGIQGYSDTLWDVVDALQRAED